LAARRPEAMQSVAAKLAGGVTVKEIADGPKFPGGTRYVAASNNIPAFCQVTGTFRNEPKNRQNGELPGNVSRRLERQVSPDRMLRPLPQLRRQRRGEPDDRD
jgi:hypothetical protein